MADRAVPGWPKADHDDKHIIIPWWFPRSGSFRETAGFTKTGPFPTTIIVEFEYCDRGVGEWLDLAEQLKVFPCMKTLILKQNYSWKGDGRADEVLRDFYEFVRTLFSRGLDIFIFEDEQSDFIEMLTVNTLFGCLSDNSVVLIRFCSDCRDSDDEDQSEDEYVLHPYQRQHEYMTANEYTTIKQGTKQIITFYDSNDFRVNGDIERATTAWARLTTD